MADCYYHGYSGSGSACSYCDDEARQGLKHGEINGHYDAVPMQQLDVIADAKVADLLKQAKKNK